MVVSPLRIFGIFAYFGLFYDLDYAPIFQEQFLDVLRLDNIYLLLCLNFQVICYKYLLPSLHLFTCNKNHCQLAT